MPRVTFSNELNDFVKGFTAGSAIYNAADERRIKEKKVDEEAEYHRGLIAGKGPDQGAIDARTAGQNNSNQPWLQSQSAVPTTPRPTEAGTNTQKAPGGWWTPERIKYATNYLETKGGLSKFGAAGLVARWSGVESAGQGPSSLNPTSKAWGIAQWLGDRKPGIMGNDSFEDQLAYAVQELHGREKSAFNVLRDAKDHDTAARGASMFERAEGYDNNTGLDNFTRRTPVRHVYETVYGVQPTQEAGAVPVQHGARGGLIKSYAEGALVTDAEPDDDEDDVTPTRVASAAPSSNAIPPQPAETAAGAPTETATPPGNLLDTLPEVLKAGLNGLQDMFGLRASAAPGGDPQTANGARAMLSGDGAAPPEQVKAVNQKVDPEGKLDAGLREIAGLNAVYKYYVDKGDMAGAKRAAAQLLQTNFLQTQQLGALAVQALQSGQSGPATNALLHAFNSIPNGKKAEVQDGKVVITDQKTGAPVDQLPLNEQTMLKVATGFADGSLYYNQLMAVASGKPSAPPAPEPDTAYEDYVAGKPSAVPTQPTAPTSDKPREPAGPPVSAAPEEESVEETFKPTVQRPQMEPEPEMPGLGYMQKGNQVNAQRIYKDRLDQVRTRNQLTDTQYKQALAQEQKDWTDKHNVSKQRRHEESGKIDEAYDNLMMARPEGAPEVPPSQQNDIKEAARGFVRTQDMSREQGVRVAMQAYDPKAQVELKDLKGGGKITFADGRSYKLDSETFSRVKKARNSFKEQADKAAADAKKPGAWQTFRSALPF